MNENAPHPVRPKSTSELAEEWDLISSVRFEELTSGFDLSYEHVLMPTVLALMGTRGGDVLDVGCGTGKLTRELTLHADKVVAIDPSAGSIEIAQRNNRDVRSIDWHVSSVEDFAVRRPREDFDTVIANMSLMDAAHLDTFLAATSALMRSGAAFVWTMTHPWFWPEYWGYRSEPWFNYNDEIFIEAEFRISKHSSGFSTTHIHRPLAKYASTMFENGLIVEELVEPVPDGQTMARYPERWEFPRFIAGRCRRVCDSTHSTHGRTFGGPSADD
jgi:ubiquinone/menaquinone biosynthesis C-methylase UbiE